ncbi:putative transcription initiation factor IIB [Organic Lake phycodnavirus 1]|jgi:transcription initiation factor TFIIB|nr:putative transcription initiation factor IIB [Organic Lake phycodnavirus 1]
MSKYKKTWELFEQKKSFEPEDNEEKKSRCKSCEYLLKITEEGFYCCSNRSCGIIIKETIDYSAEWRFYGADDNSGADPSRCGMPINPLLKESSFGCRIMCNNNSTYEMRKIRRYTEWQSMPYKEKSKYEDFQIITTLASKGGISKLIIQDAIRYYDKISDKKTYRGLNRDGLLAASIYISFSVNGNPRTSREIAAIFNLDNTSATKGCKNALSILNDLEENMEEKTCLNNSTPSSFINRYCSKLAMNFELTQLCLFIASIVESRRFVSENTPHSISTGIIYFVCQKCNLNVNKKHIHEISQISEVTINKCFKKLELNEKMFLPKQIKQKYNIL